LFKTAEEFVEEEAGLAAALAAAGIVAMGEQSV